MRIKSGFTKGNSTYTSPEMEKAKCYTCGKPKWLTLESTVLTLVPRKIRLRVLLQHISQHVREKTVWEQPA